MYDLGAGRAGEEDGVEAVRGGGQYDDQAKKKDCKAVTIGFKGFQGAKGRVRRNERCPGLGVKVKNRVLLELGSYGVGYSRLIGFGKRCLHLSLGHLSVQITR